MNLAQIEIAASAARLAVLGGVSPDPEEGLGKTLLLLGPGPDFWHHFSQSPEFRDAGADPMDRWSKRVITRLAEVAGARPIFPFDGPPWHPFYGWAERTGRIFPSPVNLLVHPEQGLWVSFRGALAFDTALEVPPACASPCLSCDTQPCLRACPVGALSPEGYDVPVCKTYIASPDGQDCLTRGCAVRRACPVSQNFPRSPAQSAFHMAAFA